MINDRPVLTQDAYLRSFTPKKWLFTKYDAFDRVIYTGFMKSNLGRSALQANVDLETVLSEERVANATTIDGVQVYYNNLALQVDDIVEMHTINYYDDYAFDVLNGLQASYVLTNQSAYLSQSGNAVTKTSGGDSWNAGFQTQETLSGDGYIEWTVTQTDKRVMVGLSATNSSPNDAYNTIDYAIYTGTGTQSRVYIYEEGVSQSFALTYFQVGDQLRVERVGDQIHYKKNGVVFHTSFTPSTGTLIGDSSFYSSGTTIEDVHIGYSGFGQAFAQNATGLATGSKVRTLDTSFWTHNETRYDMKARPIRVDSKNEYLATTNSMVSLLDFNGKVVKTHTSQIKGGLAGKPPPLVTLDKFAYDHAGRLLRQTQCINDQTEELIVKNSYDEVGQLYKKQVGGTLSDTSTYTNISSSLTVTGTTVEKTSGTDGWNGGLSTAETINGDGYVQFSMNSVIKSGFIGLNYSDSNYGQSEIDYALYMVWNGEVKIYESGANRGTKSSYAPGDVFTVERRGAVVYYLKNGVPFYRSDVLATSAPMIADISLYHIGTIVEDLVLVDLEIGLQDVDYAYNIRGWLRAINDHANLGNDLFGFELNYNTTEMGGTNDPLYNGNISESLWTTANDGGTTQDIRGYTYGYDALNRIIKADYGLKSTGSFNFDVGYDLFDVLYDRNGNIKALKRNGENSLEMDRLTYDYTSYTNKLSGVGDTASSAISDEGFSDVGNPGAGSDYNYDTNGNLIEDKNKNISAIVYNHLNLPTKVTVTGTGGGTIEYVYDANGVKLEKYIQPPGAVSWKYIQYSNNYIYEKSPNILNQVSVGLKFFSQPEGYVELVQGNYEHVYQYRDHLGNVRLTYKRDDMASILAEDDFTSGTSDWSTNGTTVTINNNSAKLNLTITDKWHSTSKYMDIVPGVPLNISFDFENGTMENAVFFVRERINGVWEDLVDRDYFTGMSDGKQVITLNLTGDHVRLYFEKGSASDDGTTTTCYIDNFKVEQNRFDIIEEHNYYPFGLKHKGYNNVTSANVNSVASKYRYVGFELNDELGLNWYDFGARNYDAALGRWFVIDNMAEKYYEYSPYHYAANNPVLNYDFNGEDFTIYYLDGDGELQNYVFNGEATKHENAYVQNFLDAYHYNVNNGGGKALYDIATNNEMNVLVQDVQNELGGPSYDPVSNVLEWNPNMGVETDNGTILSPATVLDHEGDHALSNNTDSDAHDKRRNTPDADYDNAEEKRVITGSEQCTAGCNNEVSSGNVTRTNHKGDVVITNGPTSNQVNRKKTFNRYKKMQFRNEKMLKKYYPNKN